MAISTGTMYLGRLEDDRQIWLGGERVKNPGKHPSLQPVAETIAALYDMQHTEETAAILTVEESPTEIIHRALALPKSIEDITARGRAFTTWALASYGMLGRTPDYMHTCLMALAAAHEYFAQSDAKFADNIKSYYNYVRSHDLFLTHAFASPQVDRSKALSDLSVTGKPLALTIVRSTANGVVVSGLRSLATLAPLCDEFLSFGAGRELRKGEEDLAICFAIPIATPGLKLICRESYTRVGELANHPLASRYDEIDAVALFDEVLIPWERVFVFRNIELTNNFKHGCHFYRHIGQQVLSRIIVKCEFVAALSYAVARSIGVEGFLNIQERLGEMAMHVETLRACLRAAEADAAATEFGILAPAGAPIEAGLRQASFVYTRIVDLLAQIGGSGFVMTPTVADINAPIGDDIDFYLRGALISGTQRIQLFRIAWDLIGEAFGSRQVLFERFFLGDPTRALARFYQSADIARGMAMVQHLLGVNENRAK